MKKQRKLCFVLLFAVLLASCGSREKSGSKASLSSSESSSIRPYLGRWDLTVRTPTQERPSWIELSERGGQAEGLMVGFWGHATPTGNVEVKDGEIEFTAPQGIGYADGTRLRAKLVSGQLVGTATDAKGVSWQWTGNRAPALAGKSVSKWGKPIHLFNGKNFDGWRFLDPSRATVWKVENGTLVKNGNGSEIISIPKFTDFKLHVEYNCGPMANSGVYLRGRYEVQIETDSASDPPNRRMGAIYGFLAPEPPLPHTPNVWQTYDITLVGRTVTVVHNGQTVINQQEIPGITGGALDSNEGMPGPIYLQGSERGRVAFRNIVITPGE